MALSKAGQIGFVALRQDAVCEHALGVRFEQAKFPERKSRKWKSPLEGNRPTSVGVRTGDTCTTTTR